MTNCLTDKHIYGDGRKSRFSAAIATALLGLPAIATAAMSPVTMAPSSWNVDMIADSTPVAAAVSGGGTPGTVIGNMDTENGITYYVQGMNGGVGGLPTSGTIVSAYNPSTTFQMQSYSANNGMLINADTSAPYGPAYGNTGLMTLATPGAYSSIALLDDCAQQSYTIGYTLNFSDGSSLPGSFLANDWYDGSNYAIRALGRVWTSNHSNANPSGTFDTAKIGPTSYDPRMYENDITIPAPYNQLNLTSIAFTDTGTGNYTATGNSFAVFAVSGAPTAVPEPSAAAAVLGVGFAGVLLLRKDRKVVAGT